MFNTHRVVSLLISALALTACQGVGGTTPSSKYAYITDFSTNNVSVCLLNSNGLLSNCTIAGSGFNQPSGIAINNSKVYINN